MIAIHRKHQRRGVRVLLIGGALFSFTWLLGCGYDGYESDFPVVVGNRTSSTITVFADAREMGSVRTGQNGSFSLRLKETDAYGVSASPVAVATFSAKELLTGTLSVGKSIIVSRDPPTYVAFTEADFRLPGISPPSGSTPIVADFTFSPLNPTIARGTNTVFFDDTPSSSGVTQWTWDFGDGSGGTGQRPSHTFLRAGVWVVRLTIVDSSGRTGTTTQNVTVR